MPLFKQIVGGSALVLASFATPLLAQSNDSLAPIFRTDQAPTTYVCDGTFRLQVSWMSIDANELISVTLPSSRSPQKNRTLLLPLSQSGSGMRYASDLASFHIKGDQAAFTSI
ncbi:hypothetical protein MNBD_ALPHA04-514, partial [hydrothermal vent metagenome]